MSVFRRLVGAFIVGGCIGLASQVFLVLAQMLVGDNFMVAMPLSLLFLGLTTAVLVWTGLYDKVEAIGKWGATLPFSGLVYAIAGAYMKAKSEKGALKALIEASMVSVIVLGGGGALCILVGVLLSFFVS